MKKPREWWLALTTYGYLNAAFIQESSAREYVSNSLSPMHVIHVREVLPPPKPKKRRGGK